MVRIGGKIMNFINIEQPLVSIIMACYNSIKTIDESISSVINQDYKNFELIIADDNSTDGTYEFIISKYSSSDKVKIIRNEYNKGVSGARNSALRKAKGRYICFWILMIYGKQQNYQPKLLICLSIMLLYHILITQYL
ncbi:glycosyltransferase family 2 protein [Escherichia coli]